MTTLGTRKTVTEGFIKGGQPLIMGHVDMPTLLWD
jgi:hypothetical protein